MCKTCTKCDDKKPLSEFGKRAETRDGLRSWCKECCNKSNAKWRAADPENARAAAAKYRAENPERVRASVAAYRAKNQEKTRADNIKWKANNPELVKAYNAKAGAAWRFANLERHKAKNAAWYTSNPDKVRIYAQNRRALKREAGGKLSPELSAKLFKLQRGKCACCGKPLGTDYHLDHIMPLALGGSNTDDNIQLLHATCNLQKQAKHPVDFMRQRGFLL